MKKEGKRLVREEDEEEEEDEERIAFTVGKDKEEYHRWALRKITEWGNNMIIVFISCLIDWLIFFVETKDCFERLIVGQNYFFVKKDFVTLLIDSWTGGFSFDW